jgi:hemin uptake protein HemP
MATKPRGHRANSLPGTLPADTASGAARKILVSDLMSNDRQVILEHAGDLYILRITSKGRLILTK